jgi:hypothetical protein
MADKTRAVPKAGKDGWEDKGLYFHDTCDTSLLSRLVQVGRKTFRNELWCPRCGCDPFEILVKASSRAKQKYGPNPTTAQIASVIRELTAELPSG